MTSSSFRNPLYCCGGDVEFPCYMGARLLVPPSTCNPNPRKQNNTTEFVYENQIPFSFHFQRCTIYSAMLRYLLLRCNPMHNLPAGVSCIATPKICTEHIVCCRTVSLLEPAIQVIQSNSSPKEKVSTTAEIYV
jgi:hypothetical protein